MDVGDPSNFARMLSLYGSVDRMRADVTAASASDSETRAAIRELWTRYGYIADPHTAVGYLGALAADPAATRVILATAHPAKFPEVIEPVLGRPVEVPERLRSVLTRPAHAVPLAATYPALRSFLLG